MTATPPALGFVILAHKNPDQVVRLVRSLAAPQRRFAIHVDRRARGIQDQLQDALRGDARVHLVPEPVLCRWGQWSLVQASLAAVRAVLADGPLSRVILLSGQDYPLVSNGALDTFFSAHAEREFIESFPLDEPNRWSNHAGHFQAMARVHKLTLAWRSRMWQLPMHRRLPDGMRAYGGAQWWALSGAFLTWLLAYLAARPDVERYFRRTFIPDEAFFQTLVMHSPFRDRVQSEHLRYVDFTRGHPTPPAILGMADHALLQADRRLLFARKFDVHHDAAILDRLDQDRAAH